MSDQGSLHQQEMLYSTGDRTDVEAGDAVPTFGLEWSQDVSCCNTTNNVLGLDIGQFSGREYMVVDMSGIRQHLVMDDVASKPQESPGEEVYETLDQMSRFWQHADIEPEYMRTA